MTIQMQSILDIWGYSKKELEADANVLGTIRKAFKSGVLSWFYCGPMAFVIFELQ